MIISTSTPGPQHYEPYWILIIRGELGPVDSGVYCIQETRGVFLYDWQVRPYIIRHLIVIVSLYVILIS